MSPRTGLIISQIVAYDDLTGSSLLLSLTLSVLPSVFTGHWLKASAALLVFPYIYKLLKSNRASSLSQRICNTPNLLACMYARGLLSVYKVNFDPSK